MINYEEEHRKLWNWLADHPKAKKQDYFDNWDATSIPRSCCFACEVASREADRVNAYYSSCSFCPLGGESIVGCDTGLFDQWFAEGSPKKRSHLARKIADLPWKEKEDD